MRYPPIAPEKESFDFSEEQLEALHWRLDALVNGRRRIQRLSDPETEAEPDIIRRNRMDLVRQASALIAAICGDWIKLSENEADDPIEFVQLVLRIWQPAYAMHDANDYFWDELIEEIGRLRYGDEPEILVPAYRPPGSHRQPAKLATRRLTALQWAAFLKGQAVRAGEVHRAISLAYGTDWDAIRKWRESAIKVFGEEKIETTLIWAADGYGLNFAFPDFARTLHHYGAMYREVAGIRCQHRDKNGPGTGLKRGQLG